MTSLHRIVYRVPADGSHAVRVGVFKSRDKHEAIYRATLKDPQPGRHIIGGLQWRVPVQKP